MPGTLFIVATPIGNLEDFTFRALRTLKEVDLIAAEDTRRTLKLLSHYGVSKPLVSLREHNEARESVRLVEQLGRGRNIALVSDAGTPAIADPGARLVRAARAAGIRVVPIPGPSAITAAISIAGLDSPAFTFVGFPPASRAARRKWLEELQDVQIPIVMFESPHRIRYTISDINMILVKRHISIMRELTKINEIYSEQQNNEYDESEARGEITIVVTAIPTATESKLVDVSIIIRLFNIISDTEYGSNQDAIRSVGAFFNIGESAIRKIIKKTNIMAKRQNDLAP